MKISEFQAELGTLNSGATLTTDTDCTPSSGSNNAVLINAGPENLDYTYGTVPVGSTKFRIYLKKSVPNTNSSTIGVNILGGGTAQYNVVNQSITTEGLHYIEISSLPNSGNTYINIDGSSIIIDRIEWHNDTASVSSSDIIVSSGATLSKNAGVAKFQNTGDAITVGSTITFLPTFNPAYSGTLTPSCSKGNFAQSGANWELTVTSEIASNELFDVNFTLSVFIKKSTVLTFDVVSVTGFTENNLTNDTTSATFTPSANLSVSEVSKSANGFAVNITNNGTDTIDSGQTILIKANGTNVPTGINLTATSPKGSFVGTDWVNGVTFTLSSELAVGETFLVTFSFASAVSSNYDSNTSAVWQSSVTDSTTSNNSIVVSYNPSVVIPSANISISEVSKTANGFSVNVTNNGADSVSAGNVILFKANGTNVPTGNNLTASSPKGIFAGSDWVNGVTFTLSSSLAVGEIFLVTFTFATPLSTSYASTTSAVWQSSVTDPTSTDNSIVVSFSPSSSTPPVAPILSTVKAIYSGDSQSGTAAESGTILMLLNGNVVGQTTTSGATNAWTIVCANAGSYSFQLVNTNGTSLPSSAIAVVNRPSNSSTTSDVVSGTPKKETFASKYLTAKNLMILGSLIVVTALLFWAFKSDEE